MDQFKLKSIDELDLEFVSKTRGQSPVAKKAPAPAPAPVSKPVSKPAPAPAPAPVSKPAPAFSQSNSDDLDFEFFSTAAKTPEAQPTYSPKPQQSEKKKPRPLVPIGQNGAGYNPVGAPDQQDDSPFAPEFSYDDISSEDAPAKKSKGALAGKIISIILLVATVVVFVLGCFVSIFLDNGGSNIGGTCFNTMSGDLDVEGVSPVSKGDLIISKKLEISEYTVGDMIAVPSLTTAGCDIHIIDVINPLGYDNAEFITRDITNPNQTECNVMASDCYGVVNLYTPALGGLLSFAIENAILVCILFVLLAAFWCLLLVLLEKSGKPSTKQKS